MVRYSDLSEKARENERIRKRTQKHRWKAARQASNRRTYVQRKGLSIECTAKESADFALSNAICIKCDSKEDLTLDHIIPVSLGILSRHSLDNFQIMCNSCNGKKKNYESIDYRLIEPDMSIDIFSML